MNTTQGADPARATDSLFLLASSPRPGGNSDTAARLFARGFASAAGAAPAPCLLRDYPVLPCIACDACGVLAASLAAAKTPVTAHSLAGQTEAGTRPPFGCPLTLRDKSVPLLHALATAPVLCLIAPIYFYHLPAALKALVDRTQPFWALREAGVGLFRNQPERLCRLILIGARSKGDQLFSGSLRTLTYALAPFNIRLTEPLLLYGLDGPDDLAAHAPHQDKITALGAEAGRAWIKGGRA